jgi:hypothetical protein
LGFVGLALLLVSGLKAGTSLSFWKRPRHAREFSRSFLIGKQRSLLETATRLARDFNKSARFLAQRTPVEVTTAAVS